MIAILAVVAALAVGFAGGVVVSHLSSDKNEADAGDVADIDGNKEAESYEAGGNENGREYILTEDAADKADEEADDETESSENMDGQASDTDPDKDKDKDSRGLTLNYVVNNSWQDGSLTMYGVDWQVVNGSDKPIEGWELEIKIEGIRLAQGWNGTYKTDGGTMTVTNVDYNGSIAAGAGIETGCNLGVEADTFKVVSASLNGQECALKEVKNINNTNRDQAGPDKGNDKEKVDVSALLKRNNNAGQGDDWLHTDGRRILDSAGKEVWITGLNWFGYNTGTNTFDGLYNSELIPTVEAIADRGFNMIRVPMSAQILNEWAAGRYPEANYNHAYNEELNSMSSLEIFDYFLTLAESNGLKVMIDIHSAETDASGHRANLWYTDKVSEKEYLAALKWVAARYKDNDTIIAFDLKNEPHGKPGEGAGAAIWNDSDKKNNWKREAEKAARTVLNENPNVLIMVEGIEMYPVDIKANSDYSSRTEYDYYITWWGGNLRGVTDYPIDLGKYQNKLVYSPHDYGPTVYNQSWFYEGYDYNSLMKDCWRDNWFFIYEDEIAPLLIGEWGGFMREPNLKWMTCMRDLIKKYRLNHTFWCLNPNSGDTGGLLLDDFKTWDEKKYSFVKEVLWQENGRFMGLDHAIPLGGK